MGGTKDPSWRTELARVGPFSLLSSQILDLVFEACEERRFDPGARLMTQGERGDSLYVLLEGDVLVSSHSEEDASQTIARFGRGEIVGEMALLTKEPRTATVTALGPVHALRLADGEFHSLAGRYPEVAVVLTQLLAERLGEGTADGLRGKRLDRYRIVRTIARGGMGVVYEATDEEDAGRRVALKMMSHRLLYQPGATQRFQREAQVLMGLTHDNVARIFREFEAFKTHFIAMEFCDGLDLRRLIDGHAPLPEDTVRAMVGQVADALLHLHDRSVIHRDLKPDNVITTSGGLLKLIDFGLAKPMGWSMEMNTTEEHVVLGTPLYMAPEQLTGQPIDQAVDGYGLGCITYELLTGKPLFTCTTIGELMMAKHQPQLPPREEIREDLGADLYELMRTCLEVDRRNRNPDLAAAAAWAAPVDLPVDEAASGR